jgi:hypothetical protein
LARFQASLKFGFLRAAASIGMTEGSADDCRCRRGIGYRKGPALKEIPQGTELAESETPTGSDTSVDTIDPAQAAKAEKKRLASPPGGVAKRMAQRTWWLPWLLGAAVITVGVGTLVPLLSSEETDTRPEINLPTTEYTVVYEITGTGKSPEIRYVVDGINTTETLEGVDLPWRKEFTVTVGPGVGIVQVMAANSGESDSITCAISIDGQVIRKANAPGQFSAVSCSGAVYPKTN